MRKMNDPARIGESGRKLQLLDEKWVYFWTTSWLAYEWGARSQGADSEEIGALCSLLLVAKGNELKITLYTD